MAAVSLIFFVSGAAGLIFEVVWFDRCSLVFGNSVWAASIVLSSFMGGLGLGNALVGRFSDRVRRYLITYSVLELIVASCGIALTYLLPSLGSTIARLSDSTLSTLWRINVIRLAASFGVLLLPATAMGATLPVLVGGLSRKQHRFGDVLGRLYGWNTLGSVLGALAADVVLIDRIGVVGTAWAAAALNLTAAAGAASLTIADNPAPSRQTALGAPASATPSRQTALGAPAPREGRRRFFQLLVGTWLAGCAFLILEVVWLRLLSLYVLATTTGMSVMLATVLAAIGAGGLFGARWVGRRGHTLAVASLPIVVLATSASVGLSYRWFGWLTAGAQVGGWPRTAWFACVMTGVTSFLSGLLFTLFGEGVKEHIAEPTKAAAWLTLANTTGAMCGAPLAAFLLMPALGTERTIFAASGAYVLIAWLALRAVTSRQRSPMTHPRLNLVSFVTTVLLLLTFPFGLLSGRYYLRAAQPYAIDGSEIVSTREGPSETVFLMQQTWMGQPVYSRLVTNGFSMTGTAVPGMRYMRYFAYWPMLLHHTSLQHVLVICYGAGVTAGAVLDIPSVNRVDIVELSRDIVAMSDKIYGPIGNPLHDPRVRLHVEDGRFFLQSSNDAFDLITGEPPPPRTPGAVNLYTREYFRLMYDRLAEGGMATYWLPVARPDPGTDVDTVIRAFCDVFDDCSMWNATPSDFMLAGTRHAEEPVSEARFVSAWKRGTLASHMKDVGFEQPEQIGATFLGDSAYLRQLTGSTPPLTDDFPHRLRPVRSRPSLSDPRYRDDPAVFERYRAVIDPLRARRAFASSDFVSRLWPRELIDATLPYFEHQRIVNRVFLEGARPLAQIEDLHSLLTGTRLETLPLWLLGSDAVKERIAATSHERSGATEYARGLGALARRDYRRAAAYLSEAERRDFSSPTVRPLLVYSLCLAGDLDTARGLARGVTPHDADERHFWNWLGAQNSSCAPTLINRP